MGMRSDEMERWGVASIFKESAKLLHKHYRLFLPFFLAFYLPTSMATVFQNIFRSTSSTPPLYARFVKDPASNLQGSDLAGVELSTKIVSWTLLLFKFLFGCLGVVSVSYITAYLYTPNDGGDDDHSIVRKVFKLLPRAFLRVLVTELWIMLALSVLYIVSFIIGLILYFNVSTDAQLNVLLLCIFLPTFAGNNFLDIMFAFFPFIAVLEPGNYGREALKRSWKMVRIGGVWTIGAVSVLGTVLIAVSRVPMQAVVIAGMPVWEKVILAVVWGGLDSVISVYLGVVSVVMYFVYKSRFDAGSTAIPLFKRLDSGEHECNPLVQGKGSTASTWSGALTALVTSCGYFAYDQWDMIRKHLYSAKAPHLLVHHAVLLTCFTPALQRDLCINYLILTLICEVHSIFLHLRKVRKVSSTPKSKKPWVSFISWTLNWIAFFLTRIVCHIWITAKLVWDASKFPRGFEWPLALAGMVGLNVLNVMLGQGLYKALMRERSSSKRRE